MSLSGGVYFLGELFFGKLDVSITKSKEKHDKNHFYANLGQ